MNIEFYRPLWGRDRGYEQFSEELSAQEFTGIEGHLPDDPDELKALQKVSKEYGLKYIGEICTGGSNSDAYWVPERSATVKDHIADFESELIRMQNSDLDIPFINCMGGLDAWSLHDSLQFFEQALILSEKYGFLVSFETHRTRCFYAPWTTNAILKELPDIPITADLSHWCVVAERMIDEEEGLAAIIPLVHHIHGRVGYDQGPQVPNPAAPEYSDFVKSHQNWWEKIWQSQRQRGFEVTTLDPEYGPDGYLHHSPFEDEPVADLWEIMKWTAKTEKSHFDNFLKDN